MKKALVIFAASSMFATGVSLASNVSFGQKMASFLSETFEFVGPMSGLINALVKHTDAPKTPVIPNFQEGLLSGVGQIADNGRQGSGIAVVKSPTLLTEAGKLIGSANYANANSYAVNQLNALSSGSRIDDSGSVARAITESGDSAVLANLGKSLQGRFQEVGIAGSKQDVWANLMSKPELAPTKLAMNIDRTNKQEDAGSRIAQSVTAQGLNQTAAATAASILSEANALQGTSTSGTTTQPTASQITPVVLAQATNTSATSGKVPVPGGLSLILIGLLAAGTLNLRKTKV
jgi:hypothetical protein